VMKKTQWEWVFVTALCVLHVIRPSRGADVVRALFGEHRPRVCGFQRKAARYSDFIAASIPT